ncbi:unnamed protein product [Caenorhabditis auriculariae]|uniref:Uncharacterized protein n=1 Tax=Caenorhabditis auriculariae TaxID=2777116 RepID=A0A8S1HWR3_9PELO|nr:unnamed protein product [Caenorhabditis auriculariae]
MNWTTEKVRTKESNWQCERKRRRSISSQQNSLPSRHGQGFFSRTHGRFTFSINHLPPMEAPLNCRLLLTFRPTVRYTVSACHAIRSARFFLPLLLLSVSFRTNNRRSFEVEKPQNDDVKATVGKNKRKQKGRTEGLGGKLKEIPQFGRVGRAEKDDLEEKGHARLFSSSSHCRTFVQSPR